jgi:hypothetical protein
MPQKPSTRIRQCTLPAFVPSPAHRHPPAVHRLHAACHTTGRGRDSRRIGGDDDCPIWTPRVQDVPVVGRSCFALGHRPGRAGRIQNPIRNPGACQRPGIVRAAPRAAAIR